MFRALKGCRFAGKNYSRGDVVPDSAIDKRMIGALVKMKLIAVEEPPPPVIKPKTKKQTPKPKVDDLKFNEEN